jgi:predicted nucleic acid-binding protein
MAVYVLDTSAVLAMLQFEPGYEEVERLLEQAKERPDVDRILLPFVALMEVEYRYWREIPERRVNYWANVALSWPVVLHESTPEWRRAAALVKSRGRISLADSWVAALALLNDAELVHKDPEFDAVPGLKAMRLPYDRDIRSDNV